MHEQITFSSLAGTTLTNNLYQLTLLNTGTDAIRDIAGNLLASPVIQTFAVFAPSLAQNLFVEAGSQRDHGHRQPARTRTRRSAPP